MSDLIREIMGTMLPGDVIAQLGDYLQGQGVSDVMAQQDGQFSHKASLIDKMSMMDSGQRPNPMVNSLQLDR